LSCAKTVERVKMPFGGWVGRFSHLQHGPGPQREPVALTGMTLELSHGQAVSVLQLCGLQRNYLGQLLIFGESARFYRSSLAFLAGRTSASIACIQNKRWYLDIL